MVISFFYIDYVEFLSANRVLPSHFWSSLLFFLYQVSSWQLYKMTVADYE